MRIGIVSMPIQIQIWIGINVENLDTDPDRYQNDADPQHCMKLNTVSYSIPLVQALSRGWVEWTQNFATTASTLRRSNLKAKSCPITNLKIKTN
jgi:hypothetical protein